MNINNKLSIYVKRIVGTLILITIVSMPNLAQLARLRDDIYLANESSMNVALMDISSKTVRYKNEKNKTRKLKSTDVLVIFNKVGEFIIFPKANLDASFTKEFLNSSILPQSDIIITLDKKIIFSNILNKDEELILFHNIETQKDYQKILKNEVAAIIYKNGSHDLLINPAEAVRILESQNPIIQNYRRTGVILRPKVPAKAPEIVVADNSKEIPTLHGKSEEKINKTENSESNNVSVSGLPEKIIHKNSEEENNVADSSTIITKPESSDNSKVLSQTGKTKISQNAVIKDKKSTSIDTSLKDSANVAQKSKENIHISEATAGSSAQNLNNTISPTAPEENIKENLQPQKIKTKIPESNKVAFSDTLKTAGKEPAVASKNGSHIVIVSTASSEKDIVNQAEQDSQITNNQPEISETTVMTSHGKQSDLIDSSDMAVSTSPISQQPEIEDTKPGKARLSGSLEKFKVLINNTTEKIKTVITADLPQENEDAVVSGTKTETLRSSSDSIFVKKLSTTVVPSEEERFYSLNTYDPEDTFQVARQNNRNNIKAENPHELSQRLHNDESGKNLNTDVIVNEPELTETNARDSIVLSVVDKELRTDTSTSISESSFTPSVKVTDVSKEFPDVDVEQFNHHALYIKQNLDNYLSFILDKNSDESDVNQAIDEACKMFISESIWVEVSNNGGLDYKVRFRVRDFLKHARLLKYKSADITWINVNYVENLGKGPDGSLYGLVKLQQKINKFSDSFVLENTGYRRNNTFLLNEKFVENGSKDPLVMLSDFGIIVSKDE